MCVLRNPASNDASNLTGDSRWNFSTAGDGERERERRRFIVYRECIKYVVRVSGALLRALTANRYHLFPSRGGVRVSIPMQSEQSQQPDREKLAGIFRAGDITANAALKGEGEGEGWCSSADGWTAEKQSREARLFSLFLSLSLSLSLSGSVYLDGCARRVSYEPSATSTWQFL